jgi:hypothetical protein
MKPKLLKKIFQDLQVGDKVRVFESHWQSGVGSRMRRVPNIASKKLGIIISKEADTVSILLRKFEQHFFIYEHVFMEVAHKKKVIAYIKIGGKRI